MSYKERHEEIANKFTKLNDDLEDIKEEYLEKISSNINQAVKDYKDKDLWKKSYDKTVDLFYEVLTKTYLQTILALKDIYTNISDKVPNIEDFIYKDDKMTLQQRIKQYWDEGTQLLKRTPDLVQEISLHMLTMHDRILNNEMINVKQGVKKAKRPIDDDGIEIIYITNGVCCSNGGVYLADEDPLEPPYHINCQCDSWHEFYYPIDDADLEALQELGWEDEDG